MQTGEGQRILELLGVRNLRDVGGYLTTDGLRQTRWRTLYRSASLHELHETGQQWLINAGLRTVIDLRNPDEAGERPSVVAGSHQLRYLPLPFYAGPPPESFAPDLHLGYRRELDELGEHLVRLIDVLVAPGTLPALIHCAAGKDRTGVAIGVILAALGIRPDLIATDYALSEQCLGPDNVRTAREWVLERGYDWSAWEHVAYTPPERMLLTLAYLGDRYGGARQYLLRHGLAPGKLIDVTELMTEPTRGGRSDTEGAADVPQPGPA